MALDDQEKPVSQPEMLLPVGDLAESGQSLSWRPTLLVVDDAPENLQLMVGLLGDQYRVRVANNGRFALRLAEAAEPPDLILLDVMMPDLDGYSVCRLLKANPKTSGIPVIFVTAKSSIEDEAKGLELGAVDYITKPVAPQMLISRVRAQLAVKTTADLLKQHNDWLETEVAKRTKQLEAVQDATILAMASLAEIRDNATGNHLRRTQHYVHTLALRLQNHPRFSNFLTRRNIDLLLKSAPLHDIGKVGISDQILQKPGKLTPAEFTVMKTHTTIGCSAIAEAEKVLGIELNFLTIAKQIAEYHHEKWDGSGYPRGLRGEEIPIAARLMALADVYDALINRRIYKQGMSHEQAREIVCAGAGVHFDPAVVDAFKESEVEFQQIALRFAAT